MKSKNQLTKTEMKGVLSGGDLRKFRDEECYSQEYMAKGLGLTQSTYQRIEAGNIKISLERLIKIAEILNKPIEFLLRFNTEEKGYYEKISQTERDELIKLRRIVLQQEKLIEELRLRIFVMEKHN